MKKFFYCLLIFLVVLSPIAIISFIDSFKVQPVPIELAQKMYAGEETSEKEEIPSDSFLKGYSDGWKGKWLGPIKWTISEDYRQGHMLGSYDKKKQKARYVIAK